ncbi:MAG: DUF6544 family protein [Chloroflexota bacterium]
MALKENKEMGASSVTGWRRGLAALGGGLVALLGLGWLGLRLRPAPFTPVPQQSPPPETVPLPAGLPAPVARFYRLKYGERVPVFKTAVISGRGTLRLFGLVFPTRFRFTHDVGRDYRHYFELTIFGLPVMKANEYYVDGKERMELPTGVEENNPKLDQGGNLGMWAELLRWLPAALLTDPRVRWEAVDEATALLVVPFGAAEERFVVRFDPESGDVLYSEVMRYRNGVGEKVLWINGVWFDEGRPWAAFESEEIVHNVEVDTSVAAKGP